MQLYCRPLNMQFKVFYRRPKLKRIKNINAINTEFFFRHALPALRYVITLSFIQLLLNHSCTIRRKKDLKSVLAHCLWISCQLWISCLCDRPTYCMTHAHRKPLQTAHQPYWVLFHAWTDKNVCQKVCQNARFVEYLSSILSN